VGDTAIDALDGYTLEKQIHSGARSRVYVAVRDTDTTRVALKVFCDEDAMQAQQRARRELETLSKLAGAGIPRALELTSSEGMPVLVLSRAEGTSLQQWVSQRPIAPDEFLTIFSSIAETVARVHRARLIHRDISPENIVVDASTLAAQLIDFELARPLGAATLAGKTRQAASGIAGTLLYLAPEASGRMDRGVDARSDLYSLGATMYFALSGQPPFDVHDQLEIIHAHIAKAPVSVLEHRPELPSTLARIVDKLLQKSPEDRYQTAHALAHDLSECARLLRDTQGIADDFALGSVDAPHRPLFPERLYGREAEIAVLQRAYSRALAGEPTVLCVSGGPGMGKSTLIRELHKRLVETRGHLAFGRFDEFRRELPYAGLVQALNSLIQQLLTESDERLAQWKDKLETALGSIAGALVGLVPDLELVLGATKPLPMLGAAETHARLALAMQRFIRVMATSEHPLVLALDDLQWADSASLDVLQAILLEEPTHSLLCVAIYRDGDGEGEPTGPILSLVEKLRAGAIGIEQIELAALDEDACIRLLSDALGRTADVVRPLCLCVRRKTGSAPLLIQQYISNLYDLGLIRFETPHGWSWELQAVEQAGVPEGAVAMLAAKIARLPADVAEILQFASCVGDRFTTDSLAAFEQYDPARIESALFSLCDEGLIVPAKEGFRFGHDRIREAVKDTLGPEASARLRLQVAHRLLETTPKERLAARALEIADHLNAARSQLDALERQQALEINLLAAKCALASGAASTAAHYLGAAQDCFHAELWSSQPQLAFDLFMQSVEGALQTQDFEAAVPLLEELERQPLDRMAMASVAGKRISVEAQRSRMQDVLPVVLEKLAEFGVRWPANPPRWRLWWETWRTDWVLRGPLDETQFKPFSAKDPSRWLAPMVVMRHSAPALAVAAPPLLCMLFSHLLRVFRRKGSMGSPAALLAVFATTRLGYRDDVRGSIRYAEAAEAWMQRAPGTLTNPRTRYTLDGFMYSWLRPRRSVFESLRRSSEELLEVGDVEYALYALAVRGSLMGTAGEPLALVENEHEALADRMRGSAGIPERLKARALRLLRAGPPKDVPLDDEILAIDRSLREHEAARMGSWSVWAMVLTMLGHHGRALECREGAQSTLARSTDLEFYRGISAAALLSQGGRKDRRRLERTLRESLRTVKSLTQCNGEFAPMHLGLQAEWAQLRSRSKDALGLYNEAAETMIKHGFRHQAALMHERRARLLAVLRREIEIPAVLTRAASLYEVWGATAKATELRHEAADWQSRRIAFSKPMR